MIANEPEKQFGKIKGCLRFAAISSIIAIAIAIVVFILEGFPYKGKMEIYTNIPPQIFDGVYFFVLVLLAITLIPIVLLVTETKLRKIHMAVRLDVIYRYVVYAWIVFFASRMMISIYYGVYWFPEVVARNIILGIVLAASYWFLKRRYSEKPETMFP